ncbi:Uu.00g024450.m01.CDS01 [Anthostomella pinea]|uniref:Uu.00g024450.m01.CDS01 n=1 Tax=Anthostomella pinea TaxID=933095 RepID=A0AAI8W086_9PEZI|nr:Uu.00g024450.m01.CDS01 [Anthostomella pinea]
MHNTAISAALEKAKQYAKEGNEFSTNHFLEKAQKIARDAGLPEPSLSAIEIHNMHKMAISAALKKAKQYAKKGNKSSANQCLKRAQEIARDAGLPEPSLSAIEIHNMHKMAISAALREAKQYLEKAQKIARDAGLPEPSLSAEEVHNMHETAMC